jgi:hypothetical protein
MKFIPPFLLIAVFFNHYGSRWLDIGFSKAATEFMLGGAFEAVLGGILIWLLRASPIAIAAGIIMISEGAQMVGCRLMIHDIFAKPTNINLCDYAFNAPISAFTSALYLLILCWSIMRWKNAR